jgi:hypothetical protein
MDQWHGTDHSALTDEIAQRLRSVSIDTELPSAPVSIEHGAGSLTTEVISIAAWWGNVTHRLPIRIARRIAVKRSRYADEPAMLTMLFGIGLVLLSYSIHLIIVGLIAHSILIDLLYLASLLCGAHWAAFQDRVYLSPEITVHQAPAFGGRVEIGAGVEFG